MAKLISALALAAGASAIPRIELNLNAISEAQLHKLKTSVTGSHDLGYKQPNGEAVGSRQDWTERCPAGTTTTALNCPIPEAMAFDHHDGSLPVMSRVFLVDSDNNGAAATQVSAVEYDKRATYLLKFDASDAAGNHAEQVVFALILDDTTKPTITQCGGDQTVEAATDFKLCHSDSAYDNIDKSVTKTLKYTVQNTESGDFPCQSCTGAAAVASITGKTTGDFMISLFAHDSAGTYGHQYKNNVVMASRTITVVDTTKPTIDVIGARPATHECAKTGGYKDDGAVATDTLDDLNGVKVTVNSDSNVVSSKIGAYLVKYTARDSHNNEAVEKSRIVKVEDTTVPVLTRNGLAVIQHRSEAGAQLVDPGVGCQDTCDTSSSKTITTSWGNKDFNDRVKGTYTRTYTCVDASGNQASISRDFEVIDTDAPIITLIGESTVYVEASTSSAYSDQGANCHDYTDGPVVPTISGNVVNMRVPGTYTIQYTCKDASGNPSVPIDRTVIVRDTLCPEITLKGKPYLYIEAGFEYTDAGATASDSLDGPIAEDDIRVDGDTVDTANAFYSRRSCKQIKAEYPDAKTGAYFITIWNGAQYTRTDVWCDMTTQYNGAASGFTYKAVDAGASTVPYGTDDGSCATHGMKMAAKVSDAVRAAQQTHYCSNDEEECRYFPTDPTASTNFYICGINDLNTPLDAHHSHDISHDEIAHAEAGKYVITYHVQDKAGNDECNVVSRTVVVKDTLPPVISLNFGGKVIAKSASDALGLDGVANPAGKNGQNPFLDGKLMAEQASASANAWVLAAAASAVTGLALLGFSQRKQAVVTSVPV
jgi:hypothetical protein